MSGLAVVPTYLRSEEHLTVVEKTLRTLRETAPDLDVLVVDDGSPDADSLGRMLAVAGEMGVEVDPRPVNEGFSRTVNAGLRAALERGRDAVLVNADVEFIEPGWYDRLEETRDADERPAAVVGGLLLYPNGLIQHAGVYLSFFDRGFDHWYRYAPGALPEAQYYRECPVTGALQFIRLATLEAVGLYDPEFRMGFEDVDFCIRVFAAGLSCMYNPAVRAIHHESLFRSERSEKLDEWHQISIERLMEKHAEVDMTRFVAVFR